MSLRLLTAALLCAALCAALLGAQGPAATATPTAPATESPAPQTTATATATAAPQDGGTPMPSPSPVQTASATPTAEPTAEPTAGAVPAPDPTAAPAPDPTAAPTAAAPAPKRDDMPAPARRRAHPPNMISRPSPGSKAEAPSPTQAAPTAPLTRHDGTPEPGNPTVSLATPGPAVVGVPNFFIDKFRIPPFLMPIYQAAGTQYGVRWEVLAAINEIETDYGRNLNVSSAGALGWMQFMPATWKTYGVDANDDGHKDPFNPVDAIFASARYLRAAGADTDLRRAIFAYNHADWYVDSVLLRARVIGGLPSDLVGSLTGLTQGYFPVRARATYAGRLERASRRVRRSTNAAFVVQGGRRGGIDVYARAGAPVIAVNDGRISKLGTDTRLGRYVQLQDVYGNTYTYAHLKTVARTYPAPRPRRVKRQVALPARDPKPTAAASAGSNSPASHSAAKRSASSRTAAAAKQRLFANPQRRHARTAAAGLQLATPARGAGLRFDPHDFQLRRVREGARVIAGTVLGRIGRTSATQAPHLRFEIRPAGRGAPRIDPKPILDGWKLLESTQLYRAQSRNPFFGAGAGAPSIGQIMLMSKDALAQRVLANPRIDLYACGRHDIETAQVDRRVLATLEFLAASGLKPTVSSLMCGHGRLTSSGNVSEHSSGNAVDIAAINGIPILGHQGKGSITDLTIQRLLTLQGAMRPHQIISLMTYEGADNA
ncbi:MAG TPA: lytic murein transglycosylase, partial [Baekduia sp.]|nr:lytic murein transglycosylase [Baekduia sp.]